MIKRTLYFGNPAYLSKKDDQLVIKLIENGNEKEKINGDAVESEEIDKNDKYKNRTNQNMVPIEDVGIIILDSQQITITQGLLASLLENNTAVVSCDNSHLPVGLFLPLSVNQIQSERFQEQIESSIPLRKQLWQQTISTKIKNQAWLLNKNKIPVNNMLKWAKDVRSGDPDNYEGRAAAYYWQNLFTKELEFTRDRYGIPPNNLLNYGYAILRAIVARSLVASGLLPTLGIHHHNKYNAYCLADDIMEPFRPYVDRIVYDIVDNGEDFEELSTSIKKQLLEIPVIEIIIDGERSPLMVGMQRTTASLAKCFAGEARKIIYPEMYCISR
ncbi:MAG: type II CRISPR-associated endonuclease Cas1 [Bacteroidetes bacterium]|nr:type II CRISPR-associated endonuclease Cas1 [Bacteroidota bacterium]